MPASSATRRSRSRTDRCSPCGFQASMRAMPPDDAAFEVPPGARLTLRIHYKKGWQDERAQKTDRSRVGLYFATPTGAAHAISSVGLNGTTPERVSVVAVRPRLDRSYGSIDVHAVLTDGTTVPLLRLSHPRPEWARRYWLEKPIALPAGARIEMTHNGRANRSRRSAETAGRSARSSRRIYIQVGADKDVRLKADATSSIHVSARPSDRRARRDAPACTQRAPRL